ncbi:hypothetical protein VTL71DRAFT_5823 [Oculimacula yallundae]|uniref:Uncharacterized protein n=1 Tax=Oculimacula yallundae TaxID=86028 RepID=A0ABR4BZR8_9HELO
MLALDLDFFREDLQGTIRLEGRENYCFWKKRMNNLIEEYKLEALIVPDAFLDHDQIEAEDLSYMSSLIQSTFSEKLNFYVWNDLHDDSRKLWKELQDRFEAKGKWACIMCSMKLNRMRPEKYADEGRYLMEEKLAVLQRNTTGVEITEEIERMVAIAESLPKYLKYLYLKWCVAEEEDLTPEKMQEQVRNAWEMIKFKGDEKLKASTKDGKKLMKKFIHRRKSSVLKASRSVQHRRFKARRSSMMRSYLAR